MLKFGCARRRNYFSIRVLFETGLTPPMPYYNVRLVQYLEQIMITATITAKGQITIPAEIRQALKLDTGDQIAFEEVAPGFYAFKPAQKVAVTVLKGMFGKPRKVVSIREMNNVISKRAAAAALSGAKSKSSK